MDLTFDNAALTVLDTLGYKCFCCKEEFPFSEGEAQLSYELVPFKMQNEAIDYYFDCRLSGQKCFVFVDEDSIEELSLGIAGLKIHIKSVETVLC